MKTLLLATALLGVVACGEATTTPLASIPSAIANTPSPSAAESPAVKSPTPIKAVVVAFLNAPLTVARSHYATLQVKTAARISCSIEVEYASGSSTAAGLVAKTSDGTGRVSWTWKVGGNTKLGNWPITVTCGSGSARTFVKVT